MTKKPIHRPAGAPAGAGGQFDNNPMRDGATGTMVADRETPEQIVERFERDARETRVVIDSHIASGLLKPMKRHFSDKSPARESYETGDIFIGRNSDGERMFVNYQAEFPTGAHPHGSMEDPTVLVDPVRFSLTGALYAKGSSANVGGGQNSDDLDDIVESKEANLTPDEAKELRSLWDKNHLNDLNAGTHAQTESLTRMPESNALDRFANAKAHLDSEGLLEDDGYRYGSGWLSKSVPAADVARTLELLSKGKK